MEETALHTFLFHCPTALRSVVLFGSWDNFSQPYPLELYAPKWRNLWKGCFAFSDIICDGDLEQPTSRNGPLKMGGTYWYYYKVDEDDEVHNPQEPSTTVCPLLPGQRLNVLEMPMERHSRSNSDTSGSFTRNPSDRYLTPVPPAPLRPIPSPRLGAASPEPYSFPLPSPWAPRSATYPPADGFLSPNVARHVRSASTSPRLPTAPLFADFKGLKEKLASRRSASRTRNSSKGSELEIGSPVLVSTTNDDVPLIPLPGFRPLLGSASPNVAAISEPRSIPTIRREFSPLGSHPVDAGDATPCSETRQFDKSESAIIRRRSHVPSTVITSEFRVNQGRIRANSADTRRTQHYLFSNDPWMTVPKWPQDFDDEKQVVEDDTPAAPTLCRPSSLLSPPDLSERPTSSHGSDFDGSIRKMSLDKALPGLPLRSMSEDGVRAPLPLHERKPYFEEYDDLAAEPQSPASEITDYYFSEHDNATEVQTLTEEDVGSVFSISDEMVDPPCREQPRSHFSTWSNGTLAFSDSTVEDSNVQSPTSSSFTSSSSNPSSPQRVSIRFSFAELPADLKHSSVIVEEPEEVEDDDASDDDDDFHTPYLSPTPPQLEDLRMSTFGSDIFNLDIPTEDFAPHRQAACFGLGFHYSLPEDETTSKTTIHTDATLRPDPRPSVQRESSMSQLNELMNDFAFLGDSVI